jgi:dihydrofolate synthase / folylpolyglutamate synthase
MPTGRQRNKTLTYKETCRYLLKALPVFQHVGSVAYRADLHNARRMDAYFGEQHTSFKTIHIAGTNGKGSVSHMLASILQHAGYRTGLFTSPHMLDFRERIRVNGKMISKKYVTDFTSRNKNMLDEVQPSFFEMSVFMAFAYFAYKKIDYAIIETGLGGRLDTTNLIHPEITIITNIGLDHTQILGDTLEKIAIEKAGIIKDHTPVVIGETQAETEPIFRKVASKHGSTIRFADRECCIGYQLQNTDDSVTSYFEKCAHWNFQQLEHDLRGRYQKKNIPAVLLSLAILQEEKKIDIGERDIRNGMRSVITTTGLMGRWQVAGTDPLILCDTAHNTEGMAEICRQLEDMPYKKLHMVLGFVQDKNIQPIVNLLPSASQYYICQADIQRAMKSETAADIFRNRKLHTEVFIKVSEAFLAALQKADREDIIYVGGSTFVVADFLAWKKNRNSF